MHVEGGRSGGGLVERVRGSLEASWRGLARSVAAWGMAMASLVGGLGLRAGWAGRKLEGLGYPTGGRASVWGIEEG